MQRTLPLTIVSFNDVVNLASLIFNKCKRKCERKLQKRQVACHPDGKNVLICSWAVFTAACYA